MAEVRWVVRSSRKGEKKFLVSRLKFADAFPMLVGAREVINIVVWQHRGFN